jgi:hypothetical protein
MHEKWYTLTIQLQSFGSEAEWMKEFAFLPAGLARMLYQWLCMLI